jgi:hypothetical protein
MKETRTWLRITSLGDHTSGGAAAATPSACALPVSVAARAPAAMKVRV